MKERVSDDYNDLARSERMYEPMENGAKADGSFTKSMCLYHRSGLKISGSMYAASAKVGEVRSQTSNVTSSASVERFSYIDPYSIAD